MGYFDTLPKSFADVPFVDGQVDTPAFLEAAEGLVDLFDAINPLAFKPVKADMTGNIKKIRTKYLTNPAAYATLEQIVLSEVGAKDRSATQGLLWLKRGLEFTAKALRRNIDDAAEELSVSFTAAYGETLRQFHGMLVRPIFAMAMKACPYRKDFYANLGDDTVKVKTDLEKWLVGLEHIIASLNKFYDSGNYGKGL
ncbi:hypothetical protein H4R33_003796 [Dimargaris cristalligena]|uniref:Glycolipid transfer protein domain-containing protein n=1 Tax=Dimargaris cristalligena TaxID=215637 RepID=A0A4P9ZTA6_9FUNG|nr:hypothetical protein H4R33_003796 [Dimargaris cristalligena]RKP36438.1 hypothetical protein BJ085DRAFT_38685 [Dimargaris cristalligena]|eukprot:RKP36438.1 hypothetical protein BJ085DRAFT_38685 [Dimargaris cristalligena]